MSKDSVFRILIIDDKVHATVATSNEWINGSSSLKSQHCGFVDYWLADLKSDVEIVLAKSADLDEIFKLTAKGRVPFNRDGAQVVASNPSKVSDPESWLGRFHIIVLDLGEVGPPRNSDKLEDLIRAHFDAINVPLTEPHPLNLLQGSDLTDGVKFYHRYLDHFKSARAVIVHTAHDLGDENTHEGIKKLLWPFCREEENLPSSIPVTIIHGKAEGAGGRIDGLIKAYHAEYIGLAMLLNRSQIEFATLTAEPVLILGESGTGKEHVARSIRRTWEREQNKLTKKQLGYAVLNCGCITDADAHAQLFGAVRGSAANALSHLPGIIMQACGCHVLGYEKPNAARDGKLNNAMRRAEEASRNIRSIAALNPSQTDFGLQLDNWVGSVKNFLEQVLNLIYPKEIDVSDNYKDLPTLLTDVRLHLMNLTSGTEAADDYRQKLLAHFGGRLIEAPESSNPFDLEFTADAGVLGTLFLDEFADLPPLAQSLLLRFLESGTQEIQPLGYPGRISNVKLRIIAATSDDEVARKAGVTDLKQRPDGRARAFPVRFDLVQRLRYHTIRVERVTSENARRTIESMIRTKDAMKWATGAIDALEIYAKEQAEKDTFNHRRELRRIMDLATLHVTKSHQRGLRGFEVNKITAEVVSRFLIPASAVTPDKPNRGGEFMEGQTSGTIDDAEDSKLRTEEIALRKEIEKLMPTLPLGWQHTDLAKSLKLVSNEQRKSVERIIKIALKTQKAEEGYFKRGKEESRPRCGVGYALSLGKTQYDSVRRVLAKAGISFEVRGQTEELKLAAKKQPRTDS